MAETKGTILPKQKIVKEGSCAKCWYFDGTSKCRYFPPEQYGWPRVAGSDWCGKYFEKK
jgi:hypothetical protein